MNQGILFQIEAAIIAAKATPDVLLPSLKACRYCKAKLICPSFREEVLANVPAVKETVELLAPQKIAEALDFCELASPWIEAVRKKAHQIIDQGGKVPGWTLDTRSCRYIDSVDAAFGAVSPRLSQAEFLSMCKVTVGKLEEAIAAKIPAKTKKASREQAKELLSGVVKTTAQKYLRRED